MMKGDNDDAVEPAIRLEKRIRVATRTVTRQSETELVGLKYSLDVVLPQNVLEIIAQMLCFPPHLPLSPPGDGVPSPRWSRTIERIRPQSLCNFAQCSRACMRACERISVLMRVRVALRPLPSIPLPGGSSSSAITRMGGEAVVLMNEGEESAVGGALERAVTELKVAHSFMKARMKQKIWEMEVAKAPQHDTPCLVTAGAQLAAELYGRYVDCVRLVSFTEKVHYPNKENSVQTSAGAIWFYTPNNAEHPRNKQRVFVYCASKLESRDCLSGTFEVGFCTTDSSAPLPPAPPTVALSAAHCDRHREPSLPSPPWLSLAIKIRGFEWSAWSTPNGPDSCTFQSGGGRSYVSTHSLSPSYGNVSLFLQACGFPHMANGLPCVFLDLIAERAGFSHVLKRIL